MAQPFSCLCGTPTCRGLIDGAKNMTAAQLSGLWLAKHIRELRAEQQQQQSAAISTVSSDPTTAALQNAVEQAERVVDAARCALLSYINSTSGGHEQGTPTAGQSNGVNGHDVKGSNGLGRRGPTSRELSGEMGGDTAIRV